MINKSYFMLLIVFVFGILLVGTVSAAKINYENNDMKVNFKKSFLGISTGDLGSVELKSHTSVDEVKVVLRGKQIVMWYEFDWKELHKDGLGDIEFINMRTGEEIDRDYEYVYWKDPICNLYKHENKSVYNRCTLGEWLPYNSKEIPKGKIILGVEVEVMRRDYVDVVWEIGGKKISKHAQFTEGATEITSEGGVADVTGFSMTLTANSSFGYLKSIAFTPGAGASTSNFSIHINQSGVNLVQKYALFTQPGAGRILNLSFVDDYGGVPLEQGDFTVDIKRINATVELSRSNAATHSGTLFSYTSQIVPAALTSISLIFIELLPVAPNVTLNSPSDGASTTDRSVVFNGTVFSGSFKTLVNVSLIIDGIFNETNSSGINNSDYIFEKILGFDNYNWTYQSCDNESLCTTADVRTLEISSFIENNVTFTTEVLETSSQDLELNITTIPEILSVSAFLNYNGTRHVSTVDCSEGNCTITNTIDIPLTLNLESENKSLFWEIVAFDGTTSVSTNTSENQQNVSRIHLEECDATFTTQALNFTAYDEQNLTRINPYLFDGTFDQWLGGGSVKRQSNFTNSSLQEQSLCILPSEETFFIDAIIEYDEASNDSIYTLRNYFFQNDTINNVSQDIFMYLLESSSSTSFILKVQDDSLLPVSGVLIEINRFYPGTSEFRIVQIARTDDSGKSVGFFETEIVDYKFLITLDNETLLETGIQKVIPESSPFTLTFNIGDPLGKPWSSQEPIEDLNSSLVWDDGSAIVTYIYIDSSTFFTLGRLLVVRESLVNASNNTIICDKNSSFSSATLTCTVGSTNGFYIVSSFITRDSSEELDKQFGFQIETLSGVVGLLGLFYGWFLILIASFMFKFNEFAGIWAVTITVFMVNIIGLISFGGVFVTATIAVALILTWIMES